jgi:hypothetical protein
MSGLVAGYATERDGEMLDVPGPYYHVLIDHGCDGGVEPIYGEFELNRVAAS